MVTRAELLAILPPFKNKREVIYWQQDTKNIISEIVKTHELYETQYDKIAPLFDNGDIYSTCMGLWNFCKTNLEYKAEGDDDQTVKSPTAILQPGATIDCKHYSLFIGGILDALNAFDGGGWEWCYRFVSYKRAKSVYHVFVVVTDGDTEIWVDPCLGYFNEKKQPTFYIDKIPHGMLSRISGIGTVTDTSEAGTITLYDRSKMESDFLTMLILNCFGLRTLLTNNPDITNGAVKTWYLQNGFDFNQLVIILQAQYEN